VIGFVCSGYYIVHEAGKSDLGSDAFFPNDFGKDLLKHGTVSLPVKFKSINSVLSFVDKLKSLIMTVHGLTCYTYDAFLYIIILNSVWTRILKIYRVWQKVAH